jgi:putative glycerol kinase 5
MSDQQEKYVLSIDVGTTSLRSHIYNKDAKLMGKAQQMMLVEYPKQGYCEINPDVLWNLFLTVTKEAVQGKLSFN